MQLKSNDSVSLHARFAGLGLAAFAALTLAVSTPARATEALDADPDQPDIASENADAASGQEPVADEVTSEQQPPVDEGEPEQEPEAVDGATEQEPTSDAPVIDGEAQATDGATPAAAEGEDADGVDAASEDDATVSEPAQEVQEAAAASEEEPSQPAAAAGAATADQDDSTASADKPTPAAAVATPKARATAAISTPAATRAPKRVSGDEPDEVGEEVLDGPVSDDGTFRYYKNGKRVTKPGVYKADDRLYIVVDSEGTILMPKKAGTSYAYRTYDGKRYLLYLDKKTGVYYAREGYAKKGGMQSYTRKDTGALVRGGAYVVTNKRGGRVIIADEKGKLASLDNNKKRGWVVTSEWAGKNRRYYLYRDATGADKGMYFARLGYSGHSYAHITTKNGYVRTSNLTQSGGLVYVINKDGRVAAPTEGGESGWLESSAYVTGNHRYYLTKRTTGLYKGAYYAVRGYQNKKQSGTYAHYTYKNGTVATSTVVQIKEKYYAADDTGKLTLVQRLAGVDIFSGDGDAGINISKLHAQFVIVKATQGCGYVNPYWRRHADSVLASGKLLGFYHYAATNYGGGNPEKEADFFVKTIGKKYLGKAVLALDWEGIQNGSFGSNAKAVTWCKRFLDRVYSKTGVKPLIYMSRSVAKEGNWKPVSNAGYGLWMAQYLYKYYNGSDRPHVPYQDNPTLREETGGYGSWKKPAIYQYTPEGKDTGYAGCLDFNVFYGNQSDWAKLAAILK